MTDPKGLRDDRWYLSLMSPNSKGPQFAWLDPTSIYINAAAFNDLLDDLCAELDADDVDVVAGLDAMGFVLGSALGARLRKGFLPIRKAGKLCVETDKVSYGNYSGRTQEMEMRTPAFAPGTRVLLVDQWVETGGTMDGAIRLVERQGGIVAGIVTITMEENERTAQYRRDFKVVSAVLPGSRWQDEANAQRLASFDTYSAERTFPTAGRTPPPVRKSDAPVS
ncbi:phosphoribosyltransferase family protein [Sulfitobacter sp. LCG007]